MTEVFLHRAEIPPLRWSTWTPEAGYDVLRDLRERHRALGTALALDPPEPQAGRDIPDIEGDNL